MGVHGESWGSIYVSTSMKTWGNHRENEGIMVIAFIKPTVIRIESQLLWVGMGAWVVSNNGG